MLILSLAPRRDERMSINELADAEFRNRNVIGIFTRDLMLDYIKSRTVNREYQGDPAVIVRYNLLSQRLELERLATIRRHHEKESNSSDL